MKNKDWTGGNASVFKALGATNHAEGDRADNDYYATSPTAIDKLATKFEIPHRVWEPCCGEGSLSERLKELGHEVYSSDIVDRGYGEVMDFLGWDAYAFQGKFDCILTNPPYSMVTECILRALELLPEDGHACFFLKTTALEGRKRFEQIYRITPPIWSCSSLTAFSVRRMGISRKPRRTARQSAMPGSSGRRATKVRQRLIGYEGRIDFG